MDDKHITAMDSETLALLLSTSRHYSEFEDELDASTKKLYDSIKDNVVITDSYGNKIEGLGTENKIDAYDTFGLSNNTLNFTLWTTLYSESWVFKRAIDKPSQDMVRSGITLQGSSDKSNVYKELKNKQFDLIQLLQWGALYGGSIAVVMFDNFEDKDYGRALNITKIKQSKTIKLYVTDRWYGCAVSSDTVSDMSSDDFGKPKMYNVTFSDGHTINVHHDYVIRYEHRTAPKLIKNGMLQGWGYAEGSHIFNELKKDEKLKASIQTLVDKSLIEVIKMSGMRGVFMGSDKTNQEQLKKRLEMVQWARGINSLTFLDKDDEYQQNTFGGLGGLCDLLQQNMWQISAALEMQGVLYGDLKQGFSNDVDALERYDETIQSRNDAYYRPCLTKFIKILYIKFGINEPVEFEFNSLLMKKQDEKRLESLKDFQSLLSGMLSDGVITLKQYAMSLQKYTSKGVIDFNITEQDIEKLDDKMEEELENIDLDNDINSGTNNGIKVK